MKQYATIHFTKLKAGSGALGAHIDRHHIPANADEKRTHLNKELIKPRTPLLMGISERINEGYNHRSKSGHLKKIRDDAVRAVGTIITGSHDQMKKLERDGRLDEWAYKNLEWMEKKFGSKNLLRFTVHLDERTPHIHAVFVPLTKDGRLCGKEVLGDKNSLKMLQTEFAELNKEFGLERGEENSRIKHSTTREFYRDINATFEAMADNLKVKTNALGMPKKGEIERLNTLVFSQLQKIYNHDGQMKRIEAAEKNYKKKEQKLELREKNVSAGEKNIDKQISKAYETANVKIEEARNKFQIKNRKNLQAFIRVVNIRLKNQNLEVLFDPKTGHVETKRLGIDKDQSRENGLHM